jgi:hypothetical protein
MKSSAKFIGIVFCLLVPSFAMAQSVGLVECPRGDGYVYLYSSMTTLDVRTTLQCGEQVEVTGRYDAYVGVRTAKGETGYVPLSSFLFLKDKPGAKIPAPAPAPRSAARPRTAYDEPAAPVEAATKAPSSPSDVTLPNGTPIHLILGKTISSATAHVGDVVELRVVEEVVVDGLAVIPRGATAVGIVTEVETKKRLGHGAKLGLTINFVHLSDSEKAPVRSFQDSSGSDTLAGVIRPVASGKDVSFAQGTEFTAYVDGDMHLKREAFQAPKEGAAPVHAAQNPSQPRQR